MYVEPPPALSMQQHPIQRSQLYVLNPHFQYCTYMHLAVLPALLSMDQNLIPFLIIATSPFLGHSSVP